MYTSVFTWISAVTAIVCALGILIWRYVARNDDYWKKRGVAYVPRLNPFTAVQSFKDQALSDMLLENAKKYGNIYGSFEGSTPVLFVADPDLLRDILVKDFNVFSHSRNIRTGDQIFDNMIILLNGENWKRVRTIITPAFTSKRMRQMSSIINRCSNSTADALERSSKTGDAIDFRNLFGAFTMDVIASSAFGTKIDPYNDPKNPFLREAKKIFAQQGTWKVILFLIFPLWVLRALGLKIFDTNNFFKETVLEVIKMRKEQKKRYNDVLQILMDAVEEQAVTENSDLNDEEDRYGSIVDKGLHPPLKYKKLSHEELLAQCILFFFVGYETSASTLTFIVYSLATNPEWQEKLIAEVDETFAKHSEVSYDAVRGMKILDAVISETLRMYPSVMTAERTATENYRLGDTGIVVEKGIQVNVPICALHFDSKYFEDPEKFDPERFLDSNKSTFPQYAYLPFAAGPRNCLGMRFALLEIKLCITNLLRLYRFRTHSSTKIPLEFKKGHQFLTVDEMPLTVEKRTDV